MYVCVCVCVRECLCPYEKSLETYLTILVYIYIYIYIYNKNVEKWINQHGQWIQQNISFFILKRTSSCQIYQNLP